MKDPTIGSAAEHVHFVGISGIGMSALARILLQRGIAVSGSSDRRTAMTDRLQAEGARVTIGHAAANVAAATSVVTSTAIDTDNAELVAAQAAGVPIVHRGALLATLMSRKRGIAIAGTHGKTTTTAMLARVLEVGGCDPTVVVGGERIDTSTNARDGAGPWFVSEADESDRSFLDLRPEIAIVTNIENDHIASDAEIPELVGAFETFVAHIPARGCVAFGIDEARSASLARAPRAATTVTFGFAEGADVRATRARYGDFGSTFDVVVRGELAGEIVLHVPGEINVQDALAAIAVGCELGIAFPTIASALKGFRGVRRRFEILARTARMTLVDDYAHHPTAVAATIAAARANFAGPIVVAFQPHRYTRTKYLAEDFARALATADRVVLTDVYAASEAALPGVDATTIGVPLAALGCDVAYAPVEALEATLLARAPQGALVLALGAGSITAAAARLAQTLVRAPQTTIA
ncbi:MAG: UDP-N-acetylmuramate--L-alanine ligase [Vulcanimicrobiaceae bacterium]